MDNHFYIIAWNVDEEAIEVRSFSIATTDGQRSVDRAATIAAALETLVAMRSCEQFQVWHDGAMIAETP